MKACINTACKFGAQECDSSEKNHCEDCGSELQPCPTCPCGQYVNVLWTVRHIQRGKVTYCGGCGQRWTELRISAVMADSLKRDLDKIQGTPHDVLTVVKHTEKIHKRFEVN